MSLITKWEEATKEYGLGFEEKIKKSINRNFKLKIDIIEWDKINYQNIKDKESEFNFQYLKELIIWKQKRGHIRPRLEPLIWENSEKIANQALSNAYQTVQQFKDKEWNLQDLRKVTDGLSELRGVGVATASAILSMMDDRIPFMSDEAAEFFLKHSPSSNKKLTYTWSTYRVYYEGIIYLTESLNQLKGDSNFKFTPKLCEQALFASNWLNIELPIEDNLFKAESNGEQDHQEPPKKQRRSTRSKAK